MNAILQPNGDLWIPQRAEDEERDIVGDGIAVIRPDDPDYEKMISAWTGWIIDGAGQPVAEFNKYHDERGRFATAGAGGGASAGEMSFSTASEYDTFPARRASELDEMVYAPKSEFGKPNWELEKYLGDKANMHQRWQESGDFLQAWGGYSSIESADVARIQRAASKEFGVPLSAWNQEAITQTERFTDQMKVRESRMRPALKTIYELTQAEFEKAGIGPNDYVTVYRGIRLDPKRVDGPIKPGETLLRLKDASPLESWTTDIFTAKGFGGLYDDKIPGGYRAAVLEAKIPRKHIVSTGLTGFGRNNEREFVCLGIPRTAMVREAKVEEMASESKKEVVIPEISVAGKGVPEEEAWANIDWMLMVTRAAVAEFNPYHDALGRFATAGVGSPDISVSHKLSLSADRELRVQTQGVFQAGWNAFKDGPVEYLKQQGFTEEEVGFTDSNHPLSGARGLIHLYSFGDKTQDRAMDEIKQHLRDNTRIGQVLRMNSDIEEQLYNTWDNGRQARYDQQAKEIERDFAPREKPRYKSEEDWQAEKQDKLDSLRYDIMEKPHYLYRLGKVGGRDIESWTTAEGGFQFDIRQGGRTGIGYTERKTIQQLHKDGYRILAGINLMSGAPGENEITFIRSSLLRESGVAEFTPHHDPTEEPAE